MKKDLEQDVFYQLARTVIAQCKDDQLRVLRVMALLEIKKRENEKDLSNKIGKVK